MDKAEPAAAPRPAVVPEVPLSDRPTLPPAPVPVDEPAPEGNSDAVFLKQNGQIYMVRDWETLKQWIVERRVDRHDLVSEGGVRWEPIGSRPDLAPLFDRGKRPAAPASLPFDAPTAPAGPAPVADAPFPFAAETPFGTGTTSSMGWTDDDTEGIPTGLPSLLSHEDPPTPPPDEPAPPAMLDDVAAPRPTTQPPPLATRAPPLSTPTAPTAPPPIQPPPPVAPPPPIAAPQPRPAPPVPAAFSQGKAGMGDWDDLMMMNTDETPAVPVSSVPEASPYDTDSDWQPRPSSSSRLLYGVLVALTVVIGVILVVLFLPTGGPGEPEPEPAPAPVAAPEANPEPEPEPVPEPAASPKPAPAAEPVAEPAPRPTPAPEPTPEPSIASAPRPAPAPAAPKAPNTTVLISKGWATIDTDPRKAADLFQQVLQQTPNNKEAQYGFGYAQLGMGDRNQARTSLCKARQGAPVDIQREVDGLLQRNELACN